MVRYGTVECGVWCCMWFLLKIDHFFFASLAYSSGGDRWATGAYASDMVMWCEVLVWGCAEGGRDGMAVMGLGLRWYRTVLVDPGFWGV